MRLPSFHANPRHRKYSDSPWSQKALLSAFSRRGGQLAVIPYFYPIRFDDQVRLAKVQRNSDTYAVPANPLYFINYKKIATSLKAMKRLFDLVLAFLLILPALVIILLACIPILIESRASPLFLQLRVGRHQALFRILKLRTMHPDTAHVASHEVSAHQIMRSGLLLRKTKIDELPQIWNVLIGQMSFVGPRPCLPSQFELRNAREARGVYCLRPGITGCAQIRGIDMSTPNDLAIADASYLDRWSLIKDIKIILATALGSGKGDAVARNKSS